MRYTRNRQLRKINSLMASPFTLTIEVSKKHIWDDKLDPSFKWVRNYLGCGNILKFRNAERMTCFMRAKDCKGVAKI